MNGDFCLQTFIALWESNPRLSCSNPRAHHLKDQVAPFLSDNQLWLSQAPTLPISDAAPVSIALKGQEQRVKDPLCSVSQTEPKKWTTWCRNLKLCLHQHHRSKTKKSPEEQFSSACLYPSAVLSASSSSAYNLEALSGEKIIELTVFLG